MGFRSIFNQALFQIYKHGERFPDSLVLRQLDKVLGKRENEILCNKWR